MKEAIRTEARRLGFHRAGFAPAAPDAADVARYGAWLAAGFAGEMRYLHKQAGARANPELLLPGARTAIVVASSYAQQRRRPEGSRGLVSAYGWGDDYHEVLGERLRALASFVLERAGEGHACRAAVDGAAVLERALAQRAGLGWIGKNTCLISPELGSELFLGVLLTTVELAPDGAAIADHCASCTLCLDACPTGSFVAPRVLDARRCISYLTIEHRGVIDPELAPLMGAHVAGCDICQDVCPWNARAPVGDPAFLPAPARLDPSLAALAASDGDGHRQRFDGSALTRIKPAMMVRNALVAAGNAAGQMNADERREIADVAVARQADADPAVRAAAKYSAERIAAVGEEPPAG